jgi:hypothetical protein
LPVTKKKAERVISLPMHAYLEEGGSHHRLRPQFHRPKTAA